MNSQHFYNSKIFNGRVCLLIVIATLFLSISVVLSVIGLIINNKVCIIIGVVIYYMIIISTSLLLCFKCEKLTNWLNYRSSQITDTNNEPFDINGN